MIRCFSLILFSCLLFGSKTVECQTNLIHPDIESHLNEYKDRILYQDKAEIGISFGVAIDLGLKRNGSLRGFFDIALLKKVYSFDRVNFLVGGQSEIEIFRGGLGSSLLNSKKFKFNIELRNTIMFSTGFDSKWRVYGKPAFVNVGLDRGPLFDPLDWSFTIGTSFINGLNNKRHQQIGNASISVGMVKVHYYNDGMPFSFIGFGDKYDRYWTGGGKLGFHFKNNKSLVTDFVLRYDNYTGYQRNLFELADLLKIDNLPYKNEKQQMYNQGRFQYKIGLKNSINMNLSIYEPKYTDVQNIIHYKISNNPFHARPLKRRYTFGFDYQYINN